VHLVLSLDYEMFGNGAGDVMRDVIQPTARLLRICDSHGAKLSILFEVGEYWAMKNAEEAGSLNLMISDNHSYRSTTIRTCPLRIGPRCWPTMNGWPGPCWTG
jgi:hypothetical protein